MQLIPASHSTGDPEDELYFDAVKFDAVNFDIQPDDDTLVHNPNLTERCDHGDVRGTCPLCSLSHGLMVETVPADHDPTEQQPPHRCPPSNPCAHSIHGERRPCRDTVRPQRRSLRLDVVSVQHPLNGRNPPTSPLLPPLRPVHQLFSRRLLLCRHLSRTVGCHSPCTYAPWGAAQTPHSMCCFDDYCSGSGV